MVRSLAGWDRYFRWNKAIAEVVFSRQAAGTPVYLDLEEEILEAIRDMAEPDATEPGATLPKVVKDTLVLNNEISRVFAGHLQRLELWRDRRTLDPPPTLALLSMLSLAAESMHTGNGMKPNNFYGRLAELLDLNDQKLHWVKSAYRQKVNKRAVSAILWDSLNDWLEMLEGNRGLPTVFALKHAHIGFPLSQALVRQTDRKRFGDLFALNSLPPRSSLPAFDMKNLIAEWMSRKPCPVSNTLKRLWRSDIEARERIIRVALLTLESWDGIPVTPLTSDNNSRVAADMVRAKAVLRTFPVRRLDIGLVILAHSTADVELCEVIGAGGTAVGSLELVPMASGYLTLADPDAIHTATFLRGDVTLQRANQSRPLRRRPRRIVPMRYDNLLMSFVECERAQLGEELLVLVRSEIVPKVIELLEVVARPGFIANDDLEGIPDEWTLFTNVQVLSSIPVEQRSKLLVDLNVFQPIALSQVILQGGLRLPGHIAKWSSALPPELRVSVDVEAELRASIICTRSFTSPIPHERKTVGSGAVLIWDLAEEMLLDGDYEISIYQDGEPIRVQTLRLRSADNPAVSVDHDLLPIAHDPDAQGFGLMAIRTTNADALDRACEISVDLNGADPPAVPGWYVARKTPTKQRIPPDQVNFPAPEQNSCMVTGAHLMSLEMATSEVSTVKGVCTCCGLVKRYPAMHGKSKATRRKSNTLPPRINVSGVTPVRTTASIDWAAAFDAVCHVGMGAASALARIALQMETTNLFSDAFERKLELLEHIEVERSSHSFKTTSWEVADPLVVGLADGSAVMVGFRSERMMVAVEDYVWGCKGTLATEKDVDAPPVMRVTGLLKPELEKLVIHIERTIDKRTRFIPHAAERLCTCLLPLSQARKGLPMTSAVTARSYETWNTLTAQFEQVSHAEYPGAFRLTNFTHTYIYRDAKDLGAMQAILGDARIVKYLAAADSRRSLVGYNPEKQVLYVPLGADLPGLYGRVAVLASGYPPVENTEEHILEYRNVPKKLAGHLNYLLMS